MDTKPKKRPAGKAVRDSYSVKVRLDNFARLRKLAGLHSEYRTAAAMGINRSTVSRVLSGELQPGATFIAGALVAFHPMTFEDLFEVVLKPDEPVK